MMRSPARDPDASLDRLRGRALRHPHGFQGADDDSRTGLHVAHLVHALSLSKGRRQQGQASKVTPAPDPEFDPATQPVEFLDAQAWRKAKAAIGRCFEVHREVLALVIRRVR